MTKLIGTLIMIAGLCAGASEANSCAPQIAGLALLVLGYAILSRTNAYDKKETV